MGLAAPSYRPIPPPPPFPFKERDFIYESKLDHKLEMLKKDNNITVFLLGAMLCLLVLAGFITYNQLTKENHETHQEEKP